MIDAQEEGVTGAGPQRQAAKEISVIASWEVTEGRAKEQDVQRRLWRIRGRRGGHYVRPLVVLRGTGLSRIRVRVLVGEGGGHVPQTVERGDLRGRVPTVKPSFLNKLEPPVVSAPHAFGGHLALELMTDVGGG